MLRHKFEFLLLPLPADEIVQILMLHAFEEEDASTLSSNAAIRALRGLFDEVTEFMVKSYYKDVLLKTEDAISIATVCSCFSSFAFSFSFSLFSFSCSRIRNCIIHVLSFAL